MENPAMETGFVYKGMDYLKLMSNNIQKGGTILDLSVTSQKDGSILARITTSYADDLTTTIDELIYKDDLLITWKLITSYNIYTIFSRDVYKALLTKKMSKQNKCIA